MSKKIIFPGIGATNANFPVTFDFLAFTNYCPYSGAFCKSNVLRFWSCSPYPTICFWNDFGDGSLSNKNQRPLPWEHLAPWDWVELTHCRVPSLLRLAVRIEPQKLRHSHLAPIIHFSPCAWCGPCSSKFQEILMIGCIPLQVALPQHHHPGAMQQRGSHLRSEEPSPQSQAWQNLRVGQKQPRKNNPKIFWIIWTVA